MRRRDLPTAFHATAPLRLDFAGGWSDVAPFSAREGGVVVNGAIGLRAHVELHLGGTLLRLVSEELGETLECANSGGLIPGKLPLLTAALRRFPVLGGFTLTARCDAPPGAGPRRPGRARRRVGGGAGPVPGGGRVPAGPPPRRGGGGRDSAARARSASRWSVS